MLAFHMVFLSLLFQPVSRDDAEGLLLMEEEGHSDLISFQPTDSDIPSFLEDCNRVRLAWHCEARAVEVSSGDQLCGFRCLHQKRALLA